LSAWTGHANARASASAGARLRGTQRIDDPRKHGRQTISDRWLSSRRLPRISLVQRRPNVSRDDALLTGGEQADRSLTRRRPGSRLGNAMRGVSCRRHCNARLGLARHAIGASALHRSTGRLTQERLSNVLCPEVPQSTAGSLSRESLVWATKGVPRWDIRLLSQRHSGRGVTGVSRPKGAAASVMGATSATRSARMPRRRRRVAPRTRRPSSLKAS